VVQSELVIDKDLFDPTYPLLEKFREKAPGTYRHCCNVSTICEAIALDLRMSIEQIKLAGLYHDIGKMNNPQFFSENQLMGQPNIHDEISDPIISYHIITKHVGDGVIILLQNDFPPEVVKIVSQHHGDSVLRSIKAKAQDEDEFDYRYRSSKPVNQEASILMIVDSVEAASQSELQRKKSENNISSIIENTMNNVINYIIDDGQLDNLRIGVLKGIKRSLKRELESYHHKRVVYDEESTKTIGEERNEISLGT